MELEKAYEIIRNSKPKLRFCEWFDEDSSIWNFELHSHPYHELIYYMEGKGDADVSGTNLTFSLYDTTVYPAHQKHRDKRTPERPREIICLWIDMPELVLEEPIRLHERDSILGNAFRLVYQEGKREKQDPLLLEYAIKALMLIVLREAKEAVEGNRMLDCAMEYIKNHYAEKISLDKLAGLEHISKSYLSRKFKGRTGYSVVSYINRLRIERAKQFLMMSNLSMDEIAYQVGFASPKYFHRVFKEMIGESPAGFRRQFKSLA